MKKYHVAKGDSVKVITGNFKGSEAVIKAVLPAKDRVVLEISGEDVSSRLGKRTLKKTKANPNGGLVERSVSVHVSNVALTEAAKKAKAEAKAARVAKTNGDK
ncbi:MAG: KOW motif-containing protein [Victivallaceae bacterium]|nr:KOW motif-containing protein [Victivallaceae bacterium]